MTERLPQLIQKGALMRRLRVVAFLLGALLLLPRAPPRAQQPPAPAPPHPPQATKPQQPPTFIKKVELVDIVFSVFNRRQKFITDLQKENFSVFEDNQSQEIRFFSRETDLPLRVRMLFEVSSSIPTRSGRSVSRLKKRIFRPLKITSARKFVFSASR